MTNIWKVDGSNYSELRFSMNKKQDRGQTSTYHTKELVSFLVIISCVCEEIRSMSN